MIRHLAILISALLLSGCGGATLVGQTLVSIVPLQTDPVSPQSARAVPPERLHAFHESTPGKIKLTVVRDSGLASSGCYFGLVIEGKLAAQFDTGEKADFYVTPGIVQISAIRDPYGKWTCGSDSGNDPGELFGISENSNNFFRISAYGRGKPRIIRLTY